MKTSLLLPTLAGLAILLATVETACSSKGATARKDEPAAATPGGSSPSAGKPTPTAPPPDAGLAVTPSDPGAAPTSGIAPASGSIGEAVEAARRAAAGMNLGYKPPSGPRVTLLDITATHDGPVQTGEVWHRYLLGLHKQYEACWKKAIPHVGGKQGLVVVGSRVAAGGDIVDVKVEDTFDESLGACLAGQVKGWRTPVLDTDAGAHLQFKAYFEVVK
ncbi:MAG TPA: hypothetical protein VL172_15585 [Kofleriaceae bacterium]|nr:hypothetical protein [Kofleriaceae bacterium]